MKRSVVFLCDAGRLIGSGHIMRCLTLADGMRRNGWDCRFAVAPGSLEAAPALAESGLPVLQLTDKSPDALFALTGPCDLLVIDNYGLAADFESACRSWSRWLMVIDDLANRAHRCDILLDQTLGRLPKDYAQLVPAQTTILIGPDYALLRPQFAQYRERSLRRRAKGGRLGRILISLGGADPNDVTGRILDGIRQATGRRLHLDIVSGAFGLSDATRQRASESNISVLHHVAMMADLMTEADLAIGAGGMTSWERCCVGLPTLLVITADNQRGVALGLADAGAAHLLGWHAEITADGVAAAITDIEHEPETLKAMSAAAAGLCDGRGAERVMGQIETLAA
jgi:UDP-2,4-diacetamido-2,4,6-trideoxy-beta-L-altropyranose hydrolase